MVVYGNKHPDQMVPELLENAMLVYFKSLYSAGWREDRTGADYINNLICGRYVCGNELDILKDLQPSAELDHKLEILNKGGFVCVTNGRMAIFSMSMWLQTEVKRIRIRYL